MTSALSRPRVLGIVFLALLLASVYLTFAIFTKKFVQYDEVRLQTTSIGLQLPKRADIKLRGVLVGEVLDYEADADGASVTLGIYPDKIDMIPANVTGSIVPKTLFGEKYVSLVIPERADGVLAEGDTISRTVVSTEVEAVLNDLLPLLETVQPAEINTTLTALATALEGRGEQIGESVEILDGYLQRLNPRIPELVEDLRLTSDVADIYTQILPEVAETLDNTVVTTGTLEDREKKLNALFVDVAGFSDSARTFLADNEENIVRLGELGVAQLRLLARYSTEFPCLTGGIVRAGAGQAEAFRNFKLHIVLETLPRQPRTYDVDDRPRVSVSGGPTCLNLPDPPWDQANPVKRIPDFDDGVDRPTGKGTTRVGTPYLLRDGTGFQGSAGEYALYRDLLAPGLGVTADEVGDLGPLLMSPMARGAAVSLQ
ncbi:MCE family protein [Nocardioides dongxiaopingii]|uniref:MCE family protein n=1 Tax=Nocardioides TaxID=1839 RepID=UPI0010C76386|nr:MULTISPECIES: MCE family protein [Nocardioides]QDH11094.1 MCE family protein [Nocardioides sp. S-1144]